MGQFLKVNGDYNIRTGEGDKITLDTGPASSGGTVRITGNLVVEGETIAVSALNLVIDDNIISLNVGEPGPGVSLVYAGLEIERGNTTAVVPSGNASFLYDESVDAWIIAHGTAPGTFSFNTSRIKLRQILTDAGTDNGDLTLIDTGTGVVKVGPVGYETQVTDSNDIPNKQYVDDAIQNNPTFQIISNAPVGSPLFPNSSSRVIVTDINTAGSVAYFTANTGQSAPIESTVSVFIDGGLTAQFFSNRLEIGDLELGGGVAGNEITSRHGITNENLVIRTQGTGKLQTNYALQLERLGTSAETPAGDIAYVPGSTLIYAANAGIGTSGVYFVNDSTDVLKRQGELISKSKALVFSMIF